MSNVIERGELKMNNYCVYVHINKINQKKYVGLTCQKPEDRWGSNGNRYKKVGRFYLAIQKYGWDNFEHKILEEDLTFKQACKKEQYYIKQYNTFDRKYGYNCTTGGESGNHLSEETKEKLRLANLGKSPANKGVPLTEEQKQKLIKAKTGKKLKPRTIEHCNAISEGLKKSWVGRTTPVVGVNILTKEKIYFESIAKTKEFGFNNGTVRQCLCGYCKTHKGYKWYYQKDFKEVA